MRAVFTIVIIRPPLRFIFTMLIATTFFSIYGSMRMTTFTPFTMPSASLDTSLSAASRKLLSLFRLRRHTAIVPPDL